MSTYYTSDKNWQEQECPNCQHDFDVCPIPLPGTRIYCSHCGNEWKAGEHEPNTYIGELDGARLVPYPEP